MIFGGFRVTPAPGQGPALLATVARVNKIVEKHGGKTIANFTVAFGGPGAGDQLYIYGTRTGRRLARLGKRFRPTQSGSS